MIGREQALLTIRGLNMPGSGWLVHGSAAMLLHGMVDGAGDIDIAAGGAAWAHALTLGPAGRASVDMVVRPAPDVEIFSGWLGEDIAALLARARTVEGIPVASPADILAFKLLLNRPKDLPHIRILQSWNNH